MQGRVRARVEGVRHREGALLLGEDAQRERGRGEQAAGVRGRDDGETRSRRRYKGQDLWMIFL